jgi:intracellular septation protein
MTEQSPQKSAVAEMDRTKLGIEFGPLLLFFATNYGAKKMIGEESIYWATGVFMAATILAMLISRMKYKSIAPMLWVNGVVITLFGGLTIALHDDRFIKVKPTMVNLIFATAIFGGMLFKQNVLKLALHNSFPPLKDETWHKLAIRWGLFFIFLAGINEFVWRSFSTDFWVNFKVWGVLPITMVFAAAQLPLMLESQPKTQD